MQSIQSGMHDAEVHKVQRQCSLDILSILGDLGWTLMDIDTLPFGIALPIHEALHLVRKDPPSGVPSNLSEYTGICLSLQVSAHCLDTTCALSSSVRCTKITPVQCRSERSKVHTPGTRGHCSNDAMHGRCAAEQGRGAAGQPGARGTAGLHAFHRFHANQHAAYAAATQSVHGDHWHWGQYPKIPEAGRQQHRHVALLS